MIAPNDPQCRNYKEVRRAAFMFANHLQIILIRHMAQNDLSAAIDQMIAHLAEPVHSDEEAEGWTDPLKLRWQTWFLELRDKVDAGDALPPGYGLVRAMDFDGIDPRKSSRLSRQASKIAALIDTEGRSLPAL